APAELRPTPAVSVGTGDPVVRPISMFVFGIPPRSGEDETICGLWTVGRLVVTLSFGIGVGFADGKTSAFGSGSGVAVDTSTLLGLFASSPAIETGRNGVKPSAFPS